MTAEAQQTGMKTLILFGSPRKKGNTASLLDVLCRELRGEYMVVDAYRCGISPCVDCRFCRENPGCSIDDEMRQVYDYIRECDSVVVASPIYFSELTGKLLDVGSRMQTYFCATVLRGEAHTARPKRGGVILCGRGTGSVTKPYDTARRIMHYMNCDDVYPVVSSHSTDARPAGEDTEALAAVRGLAAWLNREDT